jgi:hypothetical protein
MIMAAKVYKIVVEFPDGSKYERKATGVQKARSEYKYALYISSRRFNDAAIVHCLNEDGSEAKGVY